MRTIGCNDRSPDSALGSFLGHKPAYSFRSKTGIKELSSTSEIRTSGLCNS
jgi:hypothetical protein